MRFFTESLNFLFRGSRYAYRKAVVRDYVRMIESRVDGLKQKSRIKVLFVLPCLAKWKTEPLFIAMQSNPFFIPSIGVTVSYTDSPSILSEKVRELESYLSQKGYDYTELSPLVNHNHIDADIVFYNEASTAQDFIGFFPNALFCYVSYCFETAIEKGLLNSLYQNACWLYFVENQMLIDYAKALMDNKARNMIPTGLPIVDVLLRSASQFENPWKKQQTKKKRIIWAPHHSINEETNGLHFSTFLQYSSSMLILAERYRDVVQIAFKPHPVLKTNLYSLWGKAKTDEYYNRWKDGPNTQLEEGEYLGLFKHSDALIHDSASFIIEYLYMRTPCMFLYNGRDLELNKFSQMCFNKHYIGANVDDIDCFINNVINGIDERRQERESFFNEFLLPPNGRTVCENIIEEILQRIEKL